MHTYSWDKKELEKRKSEIEHQLERYEELFNLYTGLIDIYDSKEEQQPKLIKNKQKRLIIDFKETTWSKIKKDSIKLVTNVSSSFISTYFNTPLQPGIVFPELDLSDKELINYTRRLIETIPNDIFLQRFDYYTNPDNHFLHIRHNSELICDAYGLATVDPVNKISYGLVSRYNTIQDVITTGHESFHMIIRENEIPLFDSSNKTIYTETEGFFANMLLNKILQERGINNKELTMVAIAELQIILDYIKRIIIINCIYNNTNEQGNIDFKTIKNELKSHSITTPISKKNITYFLDENTKQDLYNIISYLTGLDLFVQYEQDPEKALHNLLKITTLPGDNPEKELSTIGVTFFEDGYINLENKCRRLLKEKATSHNKK